MKEYEGIMKQYMKKYEGNMKKYVGNIMKIRTLLIYGPWDLEKFRASAPLSAVRLRTAKH